MLMYNFCQRIVQEIKIPKKDKIKYTYQVNFTRSVHIIREFLRKKGGKNPPVEHLIAKEILPIRPGRKYKRQVKPKLSCALTIDMTSCYYYVILT